MASSPPGLAVDIPYFEIRQYPVASTLLCQIPCFNCIYYIGMLIAVTRASRTRTIRTSAGELEPERAQNHKEVIAQEKTGLRNRSHHETNNNCSETDKRIIKRWPWPPFFFAAKENPAPLHLERHPRRHSTTLPFHCAHHLAHTALGHLLHHLLHLQVLLEQTIDVLNLGAGTGRDTTPA